MPWAVFRGQSTRRPSFERCIWTTAIITTAGRCLLTRCAAAFAWRAPRASNAWHRSGKGDWLESSHQSGVIGWPNILHQRGNQWNRSTNYGIFWPRRWPYLYDSARFLIYTHHIVWYTYCLLFIISIFMGAFATIRLNVRQRTRNSNCNTGHPKPCHYNCFTRYRAKYTKKTLCILHILNKLEYFRYDLFATVIAYKNKWKILHHMHWIFVSAIVHHTDKYYWPKNTYAGDRECVLASPAILSARFRHICFHHYDYSFPMFCISHTWLALGYAEGVRGQCHLHHSKCWILETFICLYNRNKFITWVKLVYRSTVYINHS